MNTFCDSFIQLLPTYHCDARGFKFKVYLDEVSANTGLVLNHYSTLKGQFTHIIKNIFSFTGSAIIFYLMC